MQKYKLWLLFFFTIFSFTFAMIIWTIVKASQAPVHKDESFLASYHEVDDNYNDIMMSNQKFLQNYDVVVTLNDKKIDLSLEDIYYSQRVMEKRTNHKNLLKIGENVIAVSIQDKSGNEIKDAKINMRVMRTGESYSDINLNEFKYDDSYKASAKLEIEGRWNITGVIEVGDLKGYLFVKTNAI